MGTWLWLIALAVVGVIGVVVWRRLPRWREKRFLARARKDGGEGAGGEIDTHDRQLRDKLQDAIKTLENAPELKRKEGLPLYALPWYLLIGAGQTGKTALLKSVAASLPPFVRPPGGPGGPTQTCDWWCFDSAVILDTAGHYAIPRQVDRDSTQWYRFMQLLRQYRELLPINGLLIALRADTLLTKHQDDMRQEAAELRQRIDEAVRELGVAFPVYLLVTCCDMIDGFTEFFGTFADPLRKQVMGYVHDARPAAGAGTQVLFEPIFASIMERLYQLRLSILNAETPPTLPVRQKIFCFPKEFEALQTPLQTYVETLFTDSPYQHHPFFRGLFFTSAQQEGVPISQLRQQLSMSRQSGPPARGTTSYFLHDLFATILPRDQSLTRPTGRASRARRLKHLIGLGACLLLCLMIAGWMARAWLEERHILAMLDEAPCEAIVPRQRGTPLLESAERCRQVVQVLDAQNRQRSALSKLLFRRSVHTERRLQQRYVHKFLSEVLTPIDARIEQHLTVGTSTLPLVFVLITRLELLNQCLAVTGCPSLVDAEAQPDYRLMLAPEQPPAPAPEHVALLAQSYEAYLQWAYVAPDVLQREQQRQAELLRTWFAAKQFALRQILPWANQYYAPVTGNDFWHDFLPASRFYTAQQGNIRVDGAYTPRAWTRSIYPFLQRAGDAAPDTRPLLEAFEKTYRSQYFEQWQRFLVAFPQGELPWWDTPAQRRKLALALMTEDSPYHRVIDAVLLNLKPLLPAVLTFDMATPEGAPEESRWAWGIRKAQELWQAVQKKLGWQEDNSAVITQAEATLPAWVRVLRRFSRSKSRQAYLDALQQIRAEMEDDTSRENSFRLARTGFEERKPTEATTHPVMKAMWQIEQFRKETTSGDATEEAVWPLLERPLLLVWKVLLEDASTFISKSWQDNVIQPSQGLAKLEQFDFLYGTRGEVQVFVDQFMKPFLQVNQSGPTQVLGEKFPLPPDIMNAVLAQKQLKPYAQGKSAAHQVRVAATRDTQIDSATNMVEDKTEFLLACGAQQFMVTNRPPAATTVFWSFESCGEVSITVFVSCNRTCIERAAAVGIRVPEVVSLPLTKRYPGQSGFLTFIQDFQQGAHTFSRFDFEDVDEAMSQYRIQAVRVFFSVNVPTSLTTLMSLMSGSIVAPNLR
jgi:type VI secretion system protein ImpL